MKPKDNKNRQIKIQADDDVEMLYFENLHINV